MPIDAWPPVGLFKKTGVVMARSVSVGFIALAVTEVLGRGSESHQRISNNNNNNNNNNRAR
jgi:hypothetical protein